MSCTRDDGSQDGPCLASCDIVQCEGRCCYDGAYLLEGEEAFLRELVSCVPALAACLPGEFIVEGWWEGQRLGRKTATRPHTYRAGDFPAHFTHTRCVFADGQGYCELEKLARSRGLHPWSFKPAMCWLFPLQEEAGQPQAPPMSAREDPWRAPGYPGYSTCVPCGQHRPDGRPWREALAGEIDCLDRAGGVLPVLGTPGHTVQALLKASGGMPDEGEA